MPRKHYNLSEKSLEILHKVMEKRHLKTETAALEYVLLQYDRREDIEQRFGQILQERFGETILSMQAAVRQTEKSTQLLLDLLNTVLIEREYRTLYSAERQASPVLKEAEASWRKDLERKKQIKDNNLKKRGGIR